MQRRPSTVLAAAEKSALTDAERAARRELLADRLFRPDGLDRETLEALEHADVDNG